MKKAFLLIAFINIMLLHAQQSFQYEISFERAIHHEAEITAVFKDLRDEAFLIAMSRSSPGRYAVHEFAKNVFDLRATDGKGNLLTIERPNPYQWRIPNHRGEVKITYRLFANRADGTYSQVDEKHAHLNMPATFIFAPGYQDRSIEVKFHPRKDLNWKIATQLNALNNGLYYAPDLQYFMDSPTEISNFQKKEFTIHQKGEDYRIEFILHQDSITGDFDTYFEKVKKIVLQEQQVFGEIPDFDYNRYTFLACYSPTVSGDGMEHRNSTILTDTASLYSGGMEENIGTVSHEFFHAWNVERIRPKSLEPFDFSKANMSGALWFAEGFTSYYTNLILCRAGIISPEDYVKSLNGTFNYVWNSPARAFFNPVEMSYQAPFVDAATSIDPVNRKSTFISYYSYGSVLGLALDLSLRQMGLDLDGYMQRVWNTFGTEEIPYNIEDLHLSLQQYAGKEFADSFFNSYIYQSEMPDYKTLFASVGLGVKQDSNKNYHGLELKNDTVVSVPPINSPAYLAGLGDRDIILSVDGNKPSAEKTMDSILSNQKAGEMVILKIKREGKILEKELSFEKDPTYSIFISEEAGKAEKAAQNKWLNRK